MRFPLLASFLFAFAAAHGQQQFAFTAALSPTNVVPPAVLAGAGAWGNFNLISNYLSFGFCIPSRSVIEIHGPAGAGTNAPLIFGPIRCSSNSCSPFSADVLVFNLHCEATGAFALSDEQISEIFTGLWYVEIRSGGSPLADLRGQVLPLDTDGDGLPDYLDKCPHTISGSVVDLDGCSIDDLCPCDGPWKNHGQYVERFLAVSGAFVADSLITEAEQRILLVHAAASDCGKRNN